MMIQKLKESILTIGRTLPMGMECHFERVEEDPRVRMEIVCPDGSTTEYAFLNANPLPMFPLATLLRERQLEVALRDLLFSIYLHTDCMDGHIDRSGIESYIEAAEKVLGEGWEADETHPANKVTSAPAIVFYPCGSLGEPIETEGGV